MKRRYTFCVAAVFWSSTAGAENLRTPKELARAEAGLASPYPQEAIFYNPAALTGHEGFVHVLGQYHYNADGKDAYQRYQKIRGLTKNKAAQASEVVSLVDTDQFLSVASAAVVKKPRYISYALASELHYDASVFGHVTPIVDIGIKAKIQSLVALTVPLLHEQLSLGLAFKPTYIIRHRVHEDVFVFYEDKDLLRTSKRAQEGYGVGTDLGLTFNQNLGYHSWRTALTLHNLGGLALSSSALYNSNNKQGPLGEGSHFAAATSYSYRFLLGYVNRIEAHLAHYQTLIDPTRVYSVISDTRVGMSLLLGSSYQLHYGLYRQHPSYGCSLQLLNLQLDYASYQEATNQDMIINTSTRRHFFQVSMVLR